MILIIGLGNPEERYNSTRHNAGFASLNAFQKKNGFPPFKFEKKFNAEVSKKENVLLAKPQTFMNSSGEALQKIKDYYKDIENIVIVHDDVDIVLGKVKASKNRGSAGHKGVESAIKVLGTRDFLRIRIGIQPESGKPEDVETFVLKKFTKEETPLLKQAIDQAVDILQTIVS